MIFSHTCFILFYVVDPHENGEKCQVMRCNWNRHLWFENYNQMCFDKCDRPKKTLERDIPALLRPSVTAHFPVISTKSFLTLSNWLTWFLVPYWILQFGSCTKLDKLTLTNNDGLQVIDLTDQSFQSDSAVKINHSRSGNFSRSSTESNLTDTPSEGTTITESKADTTSFTKGPEINEVRVLSHRQCYNK